MCTYTAVRTAALSEQDIHYWHGQRHMHKIKWMHGVCTYIHIYVMIITTIRTLPAVHVVIIAAYLILFPYIYIKH
jgi:hypothetical protein